MSKEEFNKRMENIGNIYKYQALLELSKQLDFEKMQDTQVKIIKDFLMSYSEKVMAKNMEDLKKEQCKRVQDKVNKEKDNAKV